MTEEAFDKAIGLRKQINKLLEQNKLVERAYGICWNNTLSVEDKSFNLHIRSISNTYADNILISADAAKVALEKEAKDIREKLEALTKEFEEL